MKALVVESEKKGCHGVKPHHSLVKKNLLQINIQNFIATRTFSIKDFTIKVYSNTSIWELKEIIGKKIGFSPGMIRLFHGNRQHPSDNNTNSVEISSILHNITLHELDIKTNEMFSVFKLNIIDQSSRPDLLNENGEMIPKLISALTEIFKEYSENGKMSKYDCARFINVTQENVYPVTISDYAITSVFDKYDDDKDDQIDLEGFLDYFKQKIDYGMKNGFVWSILKRLGYRNDLRKINDPEDAETINGELLLRHSISNNSSFLEFLFSLAKENDLIQKETHNFLFSLSTNLEIFKKFLNIGELFSSDDNKEEVWESLVSSENNLK